MPTKFKLTSAKVPNGTVLQVGITYPGLTEDADAARGRTMPKVWTYALLKAGGLWYVTGSGRVPQAAGWPAIERWLEKDNREVVWVKVASGWAPLYGEPPAAQEPASEPSA